MVDIRDEIRNVLFLPDTTHATYNLEGALHDIKRFRELGIPTDQVCINTIERVIKQLILVEKILGHKGSLKENS